jgi:hypothetical protein
MKYVVCVTQDGYTNHYGPFEKNEADYIAALYGTLYTGSATAWPLYPKVQQ